MGTSCTGTFSADESVVHPGGGSGARDETVSRSKAEEPPADSLEDFRCWILQRLGIARHLKSKKKKTNFIKNKILLNFVYRIII